MSLLLLTDMSNGDNKKVRVLKLLAVKAACFLKWNLSDLEMKYVIAMMCTAVFALL